MVKIAVGSLGDSFSVASLKAYLSEFIATLIFVFAGVGSAIAFGKITSDAALDPAGLVAIAVAHAFALFVGVSVAANISGGHLNPAVTLGLAVGGNITLITGFLYWVAQCLGSTVACLLLVFVTNGEVCTSYVELFILVFKFILVCISLRLFNMFFHVSLGLDHFRFIN